jgi:hypothetical protein
MCRLFALALIVLASGCGGADSATPTPTPVDQSEVLAAFAAGGVPVRLQLDLENRPYFGVTPAVFVPASWGDVPDPPFTVALYADAGGARAYSPKNESVAGDNPEMEIHKNVELEISRSVPRERRDRFVAALKSL